MIRARTNPAPRSSPMGFVIFDVVGIAVVVGTMLYALLFPA